MTRRFLVAAAITLDLVVASTAADATPHHAPVTGSGSAWAYNAIENWSVKLRAQGIQVSYSSTGSARGREDFAANQSNFAVSDLTYEQSGEPGPARPFAYIPLVAGAVSFPYRIVVNGRPRTDVRLSGETLAGIFSGAITNWSDPAVTADNNGWQVARNLPITLVIRSDASATSYHLSDWFSTRFADRWAEFSGAGATAVFPNAGGRTVAVTGSEGVTNQLRQTNRNGAIGFVEPVYARNAQVPVAAVANASEHFVPPDVGNVSLSLQQSARITSTGEADLHLLYGNPDPRAYPLAYYSYGIMPAGQELRTTTSARQTLVDLVGYALCNGQGTAADLGYAPLPLRLTRVGLRTAARIGRVDPGVGLGSLAPARCDGNPTIAHADDGTVIDTLQGSVPQPPGCSAHDAGPCRPPT